MDETDYAQLVREAEAAAAGRLARGAKPPQSLTSYGRGSPFDRGGNVAAGVLKTMVPESPEDLALMALAGPFGKLTKAGIVAGAAMLPTEAQAGPASIARRVAGSVLRPWEHVVPDTSSIMQRPGLAAVKRPPLVGAEEYPGLVSSRYPHGPQYLGPDPQEVFLQPDLSALRRYPEQHAAAMQRLATSHPAFPPELANMPADEAEALIKDFMTRNTRSVYQSQPQRTIDLTKQWYEGAHNIATDMARKGGIPETSSAGMLAALSPLTDWDMNVTRARRGLQILDTKQGAKFDPTMLDWARGSDLVPAFKQRAAELARSGQRFRDMSLEDKALFLRSYDQAYLPREFPTIHPLGHDAGIKMTGTGGDVRPATANWMGFDPIVNAIKAYESGGDPSRFRPEVVGVKHKVPSFYNTILHPNAPMGDVVADTHQISIGNLLPLGASDKQVIEGLGGFGSKTSGIRSLYPMYVDATREAAKAEGLPLARQMQSVTWDAIRRLFENKSANVKQQVENIWRKHGMENPEAAHEEIARTLGGYQPSPF